MDDVLDVEPKDTLEADNCQAPSSGKDHRHDALENSKIQGEICDLGILELLNIADRITCCAPTNPELLLLFEQNRTLDRSANSKVRRSLYALRSCVLACVSECCGTEEASQENALLNSIAQIVCLLPPEVQNELAATVLGSNENKNELAERILLGLHGEAPEILIAFAKTLSQYGDELNRDVLSSALADIDREVEDLRELVKTGLPLLGKKPSRLVPSLFFFRPTKLFSERVPDSSVHQAHTLAQTNFLGETEADKKRDIIKDLQKALSHALEAFGNAKRREKEDRKLTDQQLQESRDREFRQERDELLTEHPELLNSAEGDSLQQDHFRHPVFKSPSLHFLRHLAARLRELRRNFLGA